MGAGATSARKPSMRSAQLEGDLAAWTGASPGAQDVRVLQQVGKKINQVALGKAWSPPMRKGEIIHTVYHFTA